MAALLLTRTASGSSPLVAGRNLRESTAAEHVHGAMPDGAVAEPMRAADQQPIRQKAAGSAFLLHYSWQLTVIAVGFAPVAAAGFTCAPGPRHEARGEHWPVFACSACWRRLPRAARTGYAAAQKLSQRQPGEIGTWRHRCRGWPCWCCGQGPFSARNSFSATCRSRWCRMLKSSAHATADSHER